MSKPVTPLLVVDIIIEVDGGIVTIERVNFPQGRALPGGCVDVGETCEHAAIREAEEETGLKIEQVRMLGIYDDPNRDPRGHAVSVAYICTAEGTPVGADDATNAEVESAEEVANQNLCFDHNQIVLDYLMFQATGQRPTREQC